MAFSRSRGLNKPFLVFQKKKSPERRVGEEIWDARVRQQEVIDRLYLLRGIPLPS